MDKEFVTYEQALALKELGFDEECFKWYHNPDLLTDDEVFLIYNNDNELFAFAPLKQQVFRWFREKKLHNTFPSIIQTRNWATVYRILEWHPGNDSTSITTSDYYDTYEEAENAAIDKLIEIAKQQDNG
jgi:hypothetical protein